MSIKNEHHKTLKDGVGKCSVPMWRRGMPAGFCDEPAYGSRVDNRYDGYVPGLACPRHGGPTTRQQKIPINHKERHIILHQNLDELIADFIGHAKKLPSETTVMELMEWSNKQQTNPDE